MEEWEGEDYTTAEYRVCIKLSQQMLSSQHVFKQVVNVILVFC